MRSTSIAAITLPALLAAALSGCESHPQVTQTPPQAPAGLSADEEASIAAELYAQQLAAAMTPRQSVEEPAIEVQWLRPAAEVTGLGARPSDMTPTTPIIDVSDEPLLAASPAVEPPPDAAPSVAPASREELIQQLHAHLREAEEAPLAKALDSAVLSLLSPEGEPDRSMFSALNFEQRDLVDRYHHVMRLLLDDLKGNDTYFDRVLFDERMDHLFGHQPIRIRKIELCRRVMGFGVYEPFEGRTFLSGRDNKMIVYVELDQFMAADSGDDQHEVKLQQELSLFSETDGLLVWRNDPVTIVDTSRNRRRDFFVVQLVTLPARLSVGKYRLKVRVADMHGGAVDETTVPIEVVADQSLVQSSR